MSDTWLNWAQRLQALAQTGLTFAANDFDRDRYNQVAAIAAEMLSAGGMGQVDGLEKLFDQQQGYATPKVDVRGVVIHGGKMLLVREKLDAGRWTLPGGWADVGESPALATEREIEEEAGYTARAVKLLALYDRNKHAHTPYIFHAYKVFFRCELVDEVQHLVANVETEETGWFTEAELGSLELSIGRVTLKQLYRFFEHDRHPDWPTDFD
ncbi:MAG: NUDIX hydrolase [Chloroflexi bacterium]|nr:NUDIX hydrolase [Chloroflexota bacterium]MCC6894623.1 NUDIX hydrolase [Anaerolineae bacterium]